jgi:hypothetical protein
VWYNDTIKHGLEERAVMSSPFPGMDPYLENPQYRRGLHHLLISHIAETLNTKLLPPNYSADIDERVYIVYEAGPYSRRVDYRREAVPPLEGEDAAWADALLREKGLR